MLKICQTLLMTIYNITSNITNVVQQLMFMIKCLNGFVIICHIGHIINHGDDDCLCKQCGFNGLVSKFISNLWSQLWHLN